MKSTLSFEEYDILVERLNDNDFKCGDWWPTVEEIKTRIEPNFNKYIEFLLWITETAEEPQTEEQKESKKYINSLLRKNLKLVDETPDSIKAAIETARINKENASKNVLFGGQEDSF